MSKNVLLPVAVVMLATCLSASAVESKTAVSRRWCMPAKYYSRSFKEDNTSVKVILLDTTPLIDKYRKDTEKYPDAGKEDVEAQLQWLEKELAGATEDWIIVGGHHPIHADTYKSEKEPTCRKGSIKSCASTRWICISAAISTTSSIYNRKALISTISSTAPHPFRGKMSRRSTARYSPAANPDFRS